MMMNVPEQLLSILSQDEVNLELFSSWSSMVEDLIQSSNSAPTKESENNEVTTEHVQSVIHLSSLLLSALLTSLSVPEPSNAKIELVENLEEMSKVVLEKIQAANNDNDTNDTTNAEQLPNRLDVFEFLRASQNWLRWCLQIYEPRMAQSKLSSCSSSSNSNNNPLSVWCTRPLLQLYLCLISTLSFAAGEMGRCGSQLLLYATFSPVPGMNESIQESYLYLATDCKLVTEFLEILLQTDYTPLQLSLVRNTHNILVSFPRMTSYVLKARVSMDSIQTPAAWTKSVFQSSSTNNDDNKNVVVSIKSVFWGLIQYELNQQGENGNPFPGDLQSRRSEMVVEILRVFYAIKAGTDLNDSKSPHASLVTQLMSLNSRDEQCYECQLATICVLMDSGPAFGVTIASLETKATLAYALETQVSTILNQTKIDDGGAATVMPILVVLNKYCRAIPAFRVATKHYIFPPQSEEEHYQELALKELDKNNGRAKNMSPLDAPKGTMRWKIIQLMTWPHNLIKRMASELLFTLCNDNPEEFILRVGMGNALPFLSNKGLAKLPGAVNS